MIRINRKTDYAVRVLLALACKTGEKRITTQAIQQEMLVPRAYLQRIIAKLSRAKLVSAYPGPHGGIQLARPAETINLRHVWEAIEGPMLISDCLKGSGDCVFEAQCPVRCRWGRLQDKIIQELEQIVLSDLVSEAERIAYISAFQSI